MITSYFGYRTNPVLNKEDFHNGVDIAADIGTKALAVEKGEVTVTGESQTYGKYLKYKTTDGYVIMYAHLSEIKVKQGEKIERGQLVALTGDTGLVTGPHLHYSIFLNENPIDPLKLGFISLTKN